MAEEQKPNTPPVETPPPVVTPEPSQLAAQLAQARKEAQDAKDLLAKQNEDKLKTNQQFKELAEMKEREANEWKEKHHNLSQALVTEKKFNTIKDAVSKLGLRAEAMADLELVDMSDVQIETTSTGRVNVLGADKFAERLKTIRPHWFSDKGAPNVNTSGARINPGTGAVTVKEIMEAEKEAKKTGDLSKVRELTRQYKLQRV